MQLGRIVCSQVHPGGLLLSALLRRMFLLLLLICLLSLLNLCSVLVILVLDQVYVVMLLVGGSALSFGRSNNHPCGIVSSAQVSMSRAVQATEQLGTGMMPLIRVFKSWSTADLAERSMVMKTAGGVTVLETLHAKLRLRLAWRSRMAHNTFRLAHRPMRTVWKARLYGLMVARNAANQATAFDCSSSTMSSSGSASCHHCKCLIRPSTASSSTLPRSIASIL